MKRIKGLLNTTAYDAHGATLGTIDTIFTSPETGQPDFASIKYGTFADYYDIVPLRGHRIIDNHVHMAFTANQMKTSPPYVNTGELTDEIRNAMLDHYELHETPDVTIYVPLEDNTGTGSRINPSLSDVPGNT